VEREDRRRDRKKAREKEREREAATAEGRNAGEAERGRRNGHLGKECLSGH